MQSYTTIQGDTWDTIAKAKYGNELLGHLIMQANPEYVDKDILIFSAGVKLNIPDDPNSAYTARLAPWERPEPLTALPEDVAAILSGAGLVVSRNHGELDGRNAANQHAAAAIVYKDMPLDTALQSMETKMTTKAPVTFHQTTPSTVWTVVHDLGVRKPEYHITGEDGVEIVGSINWNEANEQQFIVRFGVAVAGQVEVWTW